MEKEPVPDQDEEKKETGPAEGDKPVEPEGERP